VSFLQKLFSVLGRLFKRRSGRQGGDVSDDNYPMF